MRKLLLLCAALLLLTGCAVNGGESAPPPVAEDRFSFDVLGTRAADGDEAFGRYVWLSYLDLREILCADEETLAGNISAVCDNLESIGATGVFLQVRAFGDALYPSAYYPAAGRTVYADYDPEIDYLAAFCELLHARGLEVHAWVNPYRLSDTQDGEYVRFVDALREADVLSVVTYDGGLTLNPGNAAARAHILAGIEELLENYEIDGIQFDDYFYPTNDPAYDENTYAAFLENGGTMSLEDFRRAAVSELIAATYAAVKRADSTLLFGVSPDANIERNYGKHFANVALWCGSEGYVDYICPQIYFGFDNESLPFESTLRRWASLCTACDLYAGLSFYKAGREDRFAGAGSAEWQQNFDVISRQYAVCREESICKAVSLYRYASLFSPPQETAAYAGVELYNLRKEIGLP